MQARFLRALGISSVTMLSLVLVAGLIIATLLRFGSVTEQSVTGITIGITILVTLIGGFAAGLRSRSKGWLVGLSAGLLFALAATFMQYLGYGALISLNQAIVFIAAIVSASFGGMVAVSLFGSVR
ncbi:TIGR04086 family membrane protein [Salicibibacter halophilus]|uniref:TIGR04086 family membrane protein n=1 Tax=Salicibibacter halophilus TaxID=2502791 RepID=A0A514LLS4_9BACI|nr:TIGR04086 family membrane protein [Salicibibacter halophilus]QDI92822.1 TIGR04086 family membrane protein [Salicibibacter halophilus]